MEKKENNNNNQQNTVQHTWLVYTRDTLLKATDDDDDDENVDIHTHTWCVVSYVYVWGFCSSPPHTKKKMFICIIVGVDGEPFLDDDYYTYTKL